MNHAPVIDPGRDQRELVERLQRIEQQLNEVLLFVELLVRKTRKEVELC